MTVISRHTPPGGTKQPPPSQYACFTKIHNPSHSDSADELCKPRESRPRVVAPECSEFVRHCARPKSPSVPKAAPHRAAEWGGWRRGRGCGGGQRRRGAQRAAGGAHPVLGPDVGARRDQPLHVRHAHTSRLPVEPRLRHRAAPRRAAAFARRQLRPPLPPRVRARSCAPRPSSPARLRAPYRPCRPKLNLASLPGSLAPRAAKLAHTHTLTTLCRCPRPPRVPRCAARSSACCSAPIVTHLWSYLAALHHLLTPTGLATGISI